MVTLSGETWALGSGSAFLRVLALAMVLKREALSGLTSTGSWLLQKQTSPLL